MQIQYIQLLRFHHRIWRIYFANWVKYQAYIMCSYFSVENHFFEMVFNQFSKTRIQYQLLLSIPLLLSNCSKQFQKDSCSIPHFPTGSVERTKTKKKFHVVQCDLFALWSKKSWFRLGPPKMITFSNIMNNSRDTISICLYSSFFCQSRKKRTTISENQ